MKTYPPLLSIGEVQKAQKANLYKVMKTHDLYVFTGDAYGTFETW